MFIFFYFQNLSHFDGRLLLQAIGKFGPSAVKVIPQTLDTYVSITINKCRYLDFSRFLKVPLQDLVDSVKEKSGLAEFHCVKQHVLDEQLDVAVQSQVFCHDYLDSSQRFMETELPPIEDFFDRIADKDITIDQYSQVQRIWDVFSIENMEQFLEQYVSLQSLLFADVSEHIRSTLFDAFNLEPFWYVSLSGYSMDCCMHFTEMTIELLQDDEMHHTILSALRGGVTQIGCPREMSANNPELPADMYQPERETSYLHFFDFNSLYPSVMMDFPIPSSHFRFMTEFEIERLDICSISADANKGYILIVDLEYNERLHEFHDPFPLAPENVTIGPDDLSDYTKDLADRYGLKLRDEKRFVLLYGHEKSMLYITLYCITP